jgi:universal stress protein family protein
VSIQRSSVVVVGVNGSPSSVAALGRAITEAGRRQVSVEVVTAWPTSGMSPSEMVSRTSGHRWALEAQRTAFARATRHRGVVAMPSAVIVGGDAVDVLLSAAEGAACLMLGESTRGSTHGAAHSIQDRCSALATCRVVVVAEGDDTKPAGRRPSAVPTQSTRSWGGDLRGARH